MRRIAALTIGAFALVGLLAGPVNAAPAQPTDVVVPFSCLRLGILCPVGYVPSAN
jgi:hypothetical protein